MPRYFFNTRIGHELILDPEGEELRDPDHAWNVARTTIREILKTEGGQASLLNAILEVTDDDGEIVLEFPFSRSDHRQFGEFRDQTLTRYFHASILCLCRATPPRRAYSCRIVADGHDVSDCASAVKYWRLRIRKATAAR